MQLTETEIKSLCMKSREIFLSQPILLELEAPLKICGTCPAANALAANTERKRAFSKRPFHALSSFRVIAELSTALVCHACDSTLCPIPIYLTTDTEPDTMIGTTTRRPLSTINEY